MCKDYVFMKGTKVSRYKSSTVRWIEHADAAFFSRPSEWRNMIFSEVVRIVKGMREIALKGKKVLSGQHDRRQIVEIN